MRIGLAKCDLGKAAQIQTPGGQGSLYFLIHIVDYVPSLF